MRRLIAAGGVAAAAVAAGAADPAEGGPDRLDVASQRVTLVARPTVVRGTTPVTLFGSVVPHREGEVVTIQTRDCGLRAFTGVASATTRAGGIWTTALWRGITTTVRAAWKGATSAPVTVWQRPEIQLERRSARRFEVGIGSKGQFWHKHVLFQRRARGAWVTVKSVLLTETAGAPGVGFVRTSAEFMASVPRRSLVRAVLPLAQARPCYLASVSDPVRT